MEPARVTILVEQHSTHTCTRNSLVLKAHHSVVLNRDVWSSNNSPFSWLGSNVVGHIWKYICEEPLESIAALQKARLDPSLLDLGQ